MGTLCSPRRGASEGTSMLNRNWKSIAVYALALVVILGIVFAAFIVTSMCSHGVGWPICYLQ